MTLMKTTTTATTTKSPEYSVKVDAMLDLCSKFSAADFAALAKAALDQAGVSVAAQDRVAKIVDEELAWNEADDLEIAAEIEADLAEERAEYLANGSDDDF